jgi:hypothetical protein
MPNFLIFQLCSWFVQTCMVYIYCAENSTHFFNADSFGIPGRPQPLIAAFFYFLLLFYLNQNSCHAAQSKTLFVRTV